MNQMTSSSMKIRRFFRWMILLVCISPCRILNTKHEIKRTIFCVIMAEVENVDLAVGKQRASEEADQIGSKEFARSNVIPAAFASWEEKKRSCEESGNPALRVCMNALTQMIMIGIQMRVSLSLTLTYDLIPMKFILQMSLCTMHPSGAALMDPTDAAFGLSGPMGQMEEDRDGGEFTDIDAMDDGFGGDDDGASSIGDGIGTPLPMRHAMSERWMLLSPSTPMQSKTTGMSTISHPDPFELLDPHDPGSIRPIPFKRRMMTTQ
jgi:hypothetical protein